MHLQKLSMLYKLAVAYLRRRRHHIHDRIYTYHNRAYFPLRNLICPTNLAEHPHLEQLEGTAVSNRTTNQHTSCPHRSRKISSNHACGTLKPEHWRMIWVTVHCWNETVMQCVYIHLYTWLGSPIVDDRKIYKNLFQHGRTCIRTLHFVYCAMWYNYVT